MLIHHIISISISSIYQLNNKLQIKLTKLLTSNCSVDSACFWLSSAILSLNFRGLFPAIFSHFDFFLLSYFCLSVDERYKFGGDKPAMASLDQDRWTPDMLLLQNLFGGESRF